MVGVSVVVIPLLGHLEERDRERVVYRIVYIVVYCIIHNVAYW